MAAAKVSTTPSFANSEGWNSTPILIQRRAPLWLTPMPGMATAMSSSTAPPRTQKARKRQAW